MKKRKKKVIKEEDNKEGRKRQAQNWTGYSQQERFILELEAKKM